MTPRALCLLLLSALTPCNASRAESLLIPNLTVPGTADISSGPTFVVSGNFGPNDLVSAYGAGTVDLASGHFTANAAGVIVSPATTNSGNHPGQIYTPIPTGFPFGAVMIGNTALGFHPLFSANASTGLGSSTPPTDISVLNDRLGDLFGPTFTGLSNGTVLRLYIYDFPGEYGDNSGTIRINSGVAPEPRSIVLIAVGMTLLGGWITSGRGRAG